jgi:hypothetical protein
MLGRWLNLDRIHDRAKNWRLRLQPHLPDANLGYVRMFIDDAANSLLPFRSTPKIDFRVKLESSPPSALQLVQQAFLDSRHDDFDGAVARLLRESARTLLARGEVIYCFTAACTRNSEQGFIVSQVDRTRLQEASRSLPSRQAVSVYLPGYVRRMYPRMMRALAQLSGKLLPQFAEGLQDPYFDVAHYDRVKTIAIFNTTKVVGWSPRDRSRDDFLEYYLLDRYLRLERFKAELREELLKGINTLLDFAGEMMGFRAEMQLKGVASVVDAAHARAKLRAGAAPFNEIIEPFMWI